MRFRGLRVCVIFGGLAMMGVLASAGAWASPEREDRGDAFERRLSPDAREQIRRRFWDEDEQERQDEAREKRHFRQLSPEQRATLREQIRKQSKRTHKAADSKKPRNKER